MTPRHHARLVRALLTLVVLVAVHATVQGVFAPGVMATAEACDTCVPAQPESALDAGWALDTPALQGTLSTAGEHGTIAVPSGDARLDGIDAALAVSGQWLGARGLVVIPLGWRELAAQSGRNERTAGLGDIDLAFGWDWTHDDPALAVTTDLGLRSPTASRLHDGQRAVDIDAQPGTGAWVPWLRVGTVWRASETWSLRASATGWLGTEGRWGVTPGHAFRTALGTSWRPFDMLALGAGTELVWEGGERVGDLAATDQTSILIGPELAVWPHRTVGLAVGVSLPAWQSDADHTLDLAWRSALTVRFAAEPHTDFGLPENIAMVPDAP